MPILKKANKAISLIENPNIPFLYYVLSFFAVISIRNFLEIFSDNAVVSFKLFAFTQRLFIPASVSIAISFLHYYLFWTALALVLAVIFYYIANKDIDSVLRTALSIVCWIAIITPIFDLIVSKGEGINITYIYPKKITDFLPIPSKLTPGEILTSIIALALAYIYCRIKTQRIIKALLAACLIYFSILLSSILPFLIKQAAALLKIELEVVHPILVIRLLVIVVFVELSLIFYLRNRNYFLALLKSMGFFKTLHFILIFILGILLFRNNTGRFILENTGCFLLTAISIALSWCLTNLFSNLENPDTVKIATSLTTTQKIPQAIYKNIAWVVFIFTLLASISVNSSTSFFILLGIGCAFLYCLPPLKLKRFAVISKLIISFNLLLLVILGWLFAGGEILEFPHIFSLYILVFFTACLNFVDIKDYAIDKASGLKSLPVILGERRARLIIATFFLISYVLIPMLFLDERLFWPSLVLGLLQFCLIYRKNFQEKYVFLVHIISLISLLIWLNSFRIPA